MSIQDPNHVKYDEFTDYNEYTFDEKSAINKLWGIGDEEELKKFCKCQQLEDKHYRCYVCRIIHIRNYFDKIYGVEYDSSGKGKQQYISSAIRNRQRKANENKEWNNLKRGIQKDKKPETP